MWVGKFFNHIIICTVGMMLFSSQAWGQAAGETPVNVEYLERENVDERLTAYDNNLLGDSLDLKTGTLSFDHTDVSLPGNFGLEVAIRRTRGAEYAYETSNASHFGDWSLNVPHITTIVAAGTIYPGGPGLGVPPEEASDLCEQFFPIFKVVFPADYDGPPLVGEPTSEGDEPYVIEAYEYSNGLNLNIPGAGSQQLLTNPQGISWPADTKFVTTSNWAVKCISRSNGESGFEATAPNGTVYTFDNYTYRHARPMDVGAGTLYRGHAIYQATKIEDVHENTVDFTYDAEGHLREISASDGRLITLNYSTNTNLPNLPNKQISSISTTDSISNHDRTWTYNYYGAQGILLEKVTLPDGNFWEFNIAGALSTISAPSDCPTAYGTPVSTVKHPYGATGVFTSKATKHLKYGSHTFMKRCVGQTAHLVNHYWAWSLDRKVLSGPNAPSATWTYNYSELSGGVWGEMIDPLGHRTRTTYHGPYSNFSGFEVKTEIFETASSSTPLQKVEYDYAFEEPLGETYLENVNPYTIIRPRHKIETKTTRETDVYTTETEYQIDQTAADYAYGNPKSVSRSSDIPDSTNIRKTTMTYEHITDKWILGLPKTMSEIDGTAGGETRLVSTYNYDPDGQIIKAYRYGEEVAEYGYNANGTLAWVEDGLNRKTTASAWHRGKPQSVTKAAGTSEAITIGRSVNDNGWIMSQTDGRGYTTGYLRDNMGRLKRVNPSAVDIGKSPTIINYYFGNDEIRQIIDKGYERRFVYYDRMFRPIMEKLEVRPMTSSQVPLYSVTTTEYDALGRVKFKSLPYETENTTNGMTYAYDALGRALTTTTSVPGSGISDITTSIAYLAGNCTEATDGEGHITKTCKDGYGGPGGGDVVGIAQPEGIATTLDYNGFGELLTVNQTGPQGGNQTQKFFYNDERRLCRSYVPEAGNTLYEYDDAGQMEYYAKGITGTAETCDSPIGEATQVKLTYDALGRAKTTEFLDIATPNIWRDYDKNGNVTKVFRGQNGDVDGELCLTSTGANCWFYEYDEYNRLKVQELQIDDRSFEQKYYYNGYGYMYRQTLPTGRIILSTLDGAGRTLGIGWGNDAANGFKYHPNGQVQEFRYGNGIYFDNILNPLQQLERRFIRQNDANDVIIATPLDVSYDYDKNGRITDQTYNLHFDGQTNPNNRTYGYDGAGRLTSAVSTSFGGTGTASFSYDALGNLLTKEIRGRIVTNSYDTLTNRLTQSAEGAGGPDGAMTRAITYDNRGNIETIGGLTFEYDMADQPLKAYGTNRKGVYIGGENDNSYAYDGNLKRVKSVINGVTRYNVYDKEGRLAHVEEGADLATSIQTDYLHAAGMTLARIKDGVFTYMHPDHLGSASAGTNEDGSIAFTEFHTPFGEALLNAAANDNQSDFTGHIRDTDIGMSYMQARYMDPNIGRFLSMDPVTFVDTGEPGMFSRYSYSLNDPVNLTDANGECPICLAVIKQGAKKQIKRSLKKRLLSSAANFEKAEAAIDLGFAAMDGPGALAGEVANIAMDKVVGKAKVAKGAIPKPPRGKGSVPKDQRDPQRRFSDKQQQEMIDRQGGKCANGCGKDIDISTSQGHHVQRHADGGPTTLDNGRQPCTDCHKKIHSKDD